MRPPIRALRATTVAVVMAAGMALLTACDEPAFTGTSTSGGTSTDQDAGVPQDDAATTWEVGDRPGPVELTGTGTDGVEINVADHRGQVVVINTWFSSCPPCRAEIGDLVAVANQSTADGVVFIGLNPVDEATAVQAFMDENEVPYQSIVDPNQTAMSQLAGVVPVNATPTTIVLDREGNVYARVIGMVDRITLTRLVADVVAEPAPTQGP